MMRLSSMPARVLRRGARAFTLIELMVVVAVIALVTSAVAPMVFSSMMANKITSAGESLTGTLSYAHQLAVSGNQEIEVRFYSYEDSSAPGSARGYRAVALVRASGNTAGAGRTALGQQLGETFYLPSGVVISQGSKLSPPLTHITATPDREDIIKKAGVSDYRAFHFLPDGGTNLDTLGIAPNLCYFTLAEDKPADKAGDDVPKNFYTIQIDPITGRVVPYRP